jgi:protein SCO1/2
MLFAQEVTDNADEPDIGITEKLDTYVPGDITLMNAQLGKVTLAEVIDKPTIISFVYYRCPGICSPLMDGIASVIDRSNLKLGEDYQVLTISFDPTEDLGLAQKKKKNYLGLMEKKEVAKESWLFFTSDSANIARLTSSTGFRYKRTGYDFVHSAGLIFLSPERKITRYLNGVSYLPFEYKMAIIEASEGKSGPTINKVLQYCYSYDPEGQGYVLNITRVAGIIIIFLTLSIFLYLVLKPVVKRKAA